MVIQKIQPGGVQMRIKPLHDWALVRPKEAEERTYGGIYVPDTAKERPQEGEVIAIGEGKFVEEEKEGKTKGKKEKKFVKTTLKVGDRILYEKYGARKIEIDGEEIYMVREEDVLGCFEK
jgi:chaperonin GroES